MLNLLVECVGAHVALQFAGVGLEGRGGIGGEQDILYVDEQKRPC